MNLQRAHSRASLRLAASKQPLRRLAVACQGSITASRRSLLALPVLGGVWWLPQRSDAKEDVFSEYLFKVFPQPPSPVKFPRKALDQRFAVLLMRSAYDAVDELDYMPMDEFQKNFWKLRQAEVEPYNIQQLPLRAKQGDLTDPLYFDFISFSQYAAIDHSLASPAQVFLEYCDECEGGKRLVRRDPALSDDSLLAVRHAEKTGDMIYRGLVNGFREEVFGGPPPRSRSSSVGELMGDIQKILDIMVGRGYALKALVSDVQEQPGGGGSFTVSVKAPANLWALESLTYRRAKLLNTYDALVVAAYLRASGRTALQYDLSLSDVGTVTSWRFS